jgi:uncharacterized hydrophobic protein (TIGR00271 family)
MEEKRNAVKRLIDLSTNDYGYYLFLILSILITTAGLLMQSSPVVIGGMIIAPLLIPLLGCGLSLLLLEMQGFIRALSIVFFSVGLALIISAAMTMMSLLVGPVDIVIDYAPSNFPQGLYLLVAFCSGVAGAFAFVKSHLSSSLSGVAVSASLVPPLCSIGIGISLHHADLIHKSLSIFLLNVVGIAAAAAMVFWILGFGEMRAVEKRAVNDADA